MKDTESMEAAAPVEAAAPPKIIAAPPEVAAAPSQPAAAPARFFPPKRVTLSFDRASNMRTHPGHQADLADVTHFLAAPERVQFLAQNGFEPKPGLHR